jgi:DNA replication protein DnaC
MVRYNRDQARTIKRYSTTAPRRPLTMSRRSPATGKHPDPQQRILNHLETLGVPLTSEQLGCALREAEQGGWSHLQLLDRLFAEPAASKRERTVARRIRDAHFPEQKTLESFDWEFNAQAIDRVQIEELATGDFIRRADNLLMVGQSGIGKSHLLEGIGRRACSLGYRVRYIASDELLADLGASLADGTTPKRIRYYTRFDLLIIDGFGFDRIERQETPQALSLLFKVIDKRNPRRSTALITNIDIDTWNEYLGDPPMVMALLDRLHDRAILMRIAKAKSYRAHRARRLSSGTSQSTRRPCSGKKAKRKSQHG